MNKFYAAYALANSLYDVSLDPSSFEDMALNAWDLIGNKQTRLYKYTTSTENKRIKLPCNVEILEAVFCPNLAAQTANNMSPTPDVSNIFIENYIEAWKTGKKSLYEPGSLVSYRQEGDELVFDKDYSNLTVLYFGIIVDEDGLPYLSEKETQAIANYLLYASLYKKALTLKDGNLLQLAMNAKNDWLRSCNAARAPKHLTQNEMNDVLDVKTRWDRKQYGKAFNVII